MMEAENVTVTETKKRGRPSTGKAMTAAERQRASRAARRNAQFEDFNGRQVSLMLSPEAAMALGCLCWAGNRDKPQKLTQKEVIEKLLIEAYRAQSLVADVERVDPSLVVEADYPLVVYRPENGRDKAKGWEIFANPHRWDADIFKTESGVKCYKLRDMSQEVDADVSDLSRYDRFEYVELEDTLVHVEKMGLRRDAQYIRQRLFELSGVVYEG